ncbi:hypothetical protein [Olsenella sp. Marseille-P4559]|jgi:hypothetical protein|uniref:hypothetical protein n=1 Tax=Olsenella sp. Marseille-P4559 TaxID=2364795 RepID=UPI00102FF236|nr:hypothetical protein [Olsenella sp. Marseille-P4559]
MSTIDVHPRIHTRHPEISVGDVVAAMRGMVCYHQRESGEWLSVGFDERNRLLELVYVYDSVKDGFLVYHAMTPPSGRTLRELGLERRG